MTSTTLNNKEPQNTKRTTQQNDYIKLISSDGFEFQISKPVAVESPFIKDILSSPATFIENKHNEIHLREINAVILEKAIQYLYYKNKYNESNDDDDDIPHFIIEPEIAVELLMASNFLGI
ncbi:hypothetical protein MP638_006960 [Amoeboaphelidium occidentale]|nr:hypothetical protein MP638_006960 [Amoeboaphelidium occidentale]